ncbi:hypothetical protein SNOG_15303 [Parastagonospora nodorum SN15]|uniref:Uncharacterized protein n=1 Tax=Phaeosphaeria nodorum (strain SN15 / ATCC MYA-4574 / FGSC 10173) TaxID=321614 RepID=Q0TYN9_PHANO|nr:hypothetical protein SNOG_15303 [Parastagonospora nodorum SN15]EAT77236.1 hypothetical protein SNOG_15303 [Parastagonospora nodorum SN15]
MHAGVILDYEQQRLKRERQADFEMQHADLPQPALLNDLQRAQRHSMEWLATLLNTGSDDGLIIGV